MSLPPHGPCTCECHYDSCNRCPAGGIGCCGNHKKHWNGSEYVDKFVTFRTRHVQPEPEVVTDPSESESDVPSTEH